jgi:hypothetical protein
MVKISSKAPAVQHIKKVQTGRIARRIGGKPYKRMQAVQEEKAFKLGQALYRTIKKYVAPAADAFLVSKGKVSTGNSNIDFQVTMNVIKDEVSIDRNFIPISKTQLEKISNARNDTDHDDFSSLYKRSDRHFSVLKNLCVCIGDNVAAGEVQRIWDLARQEDFKAALSFAFRFTTQYDGHVAASLSEIIFGVIDKYLINAMWEFRDSTEIGDPPIDAYANLKYLINKQSVNVDYLAQGGNARGDKKTLKLCMEARLRNRHGGNTKTFSGWKDDLDAIIRFLRVINDPDGAQEVEVIRDKLIAARTNNTEVTSEMFPSIF